MHKCVHDLDTLLHVGDSVESGVDHVYNHYFHLFDSRTKSVVVFVPDGGLYIENYIFDFAELKQVTWKRGLNLSERACDLGTFLTTEYWQLSLLTIFAVCKVNLAITDLIKLKNK